MGDRSRNGNRGGLGMGGNRGGWWVTAVGNGICNMNHGWWVTEVQMRIGVGGSEKWEC